MQKALSLLRRLLFLENRADASGGGAALMNSAGSLVWNATFRKNSAARGGGIAFQGHPPLCLDKRLGSVAPCPASSAPDYALTFDGNKATKHSPNAASGNAVLVVSNDPAVVQTSDAAISPPLEVRLTDSYGNLIAEDPPSPVVVTVAVSSRTPGAVVAGQMQRVLRKGVAVFGGSDQGVKQNSNFHLRLLGVPGKTYELSIVAFLPISDLFGAQDVAAAAFSVPLRTCVPGEYFDAENSLKCVVAPPGTVTTQPNQLAPHACPDGEFNTESNRTSCQRCPVGTHTNEHTLHVTCHACPPGTKSGAGAAVCTPCEIGTYSDGKRPSDVCLKCLGGFANLAGQSHCTVCDDGKYMVQPTTGASYCADCPLNANCVPTADPPVIAHTDYFLTRNAQTSTLSTIRCNVLSCVNGECAAGRVNVSQNPLCGQCLDGYSEYDNTSVVASFSSFAASALSVCMLCVLYVCVLCVCVMYVVCMCYIYTCVCYACVYALCVCVRASVCVHRTHTQSNKPHI